MLLYSVNFQCSWCVHLSNWICILSFHEYLIWIKGTKKIFDAFILQWETRDQCTTFHINEYYSIKDLYHERAWMTSGIFSVQVHVYIVCILSQLYKYLLNWQNCLLRLDKNYCWSTKQRAWFGSSTTVNQSLSRRYSMEYWPFCYIHAFYIMPC